MYNIDFSTSVIIQAKQERVSNDEVHGPTACRHSSPTIARSAPTFSFPLIVPAPVGRLSFCVRGWVSITPTRCFLVLGRTVPWPVASSRRVPT